MVFWSITIKKMGSSGIRDGSCTVEAKRLLSPDGLTSDSDSSLGLRTPAWKDGSCPSSAAPTRGGWHNRSPIGTLILVEVGGAVAFTLGIVRYERLVPPPARSSAILPRLTQCDSPPG